MRLSLTVAMVALKQGFKQLPAVCVCVNVKSECVEVMKNGADALECVISSKWLGSRIMECRRKGPFLRYSSL